MTLAASLSQTIDVLPIVRVIDETGEMHGVALAQMGKDMPGANLVTLLGRIGNPVGKEKKFPHVDQPRFRAIRGPIKLASHSGNCCQIAISGRDLGLSGLMDGISLPPSRKYS